MRLLIVVVGLFYTSLAWSSQPVKGCFLAKKSCPALRSIKKNTNPKSLFVEPGRSYTLIAKNKTSPTHYLVDVENSQEHRWVSVACGVKQDVCENMATHPALVETSEPEFILALSWQPSFCETHSKKVECKNLNANRFDSKNLAIHGLWPQPRDNAYCNVSVKDKSIDRRKRWDLLEKLPLSKETRQQLSVAMPGYASNLHRHEWIKHGTCFSGSADDYYKTTIKLATIINTSEVGELMRSHIGKKLSAKRIRQSFDQAFGQGAGAKVRLLCDKQQRVGELFISLKGRLLATADKPMLSEWLKAAPALSDKCNAGYVDPA